MRPLLVITHGQNTLGRTRARMRLWTSFLGWIGSTHILFLTNAQQAIKNMFLPTQPLAIRRTAPTILNRPVGFYCIHRLRLLITCLLLLTLDVMYPAITSPLLQPEIASASLPIHWSVENRGMILRISSSSPRARSAAFLLISSLNRHPNTHPCLQSPV
jgi:hypothetical protein